MGNEKFKVGAWVVERYYGRIGFVTKMMRSEEKCYVQMIRNIDGTKNTTAGWFGFPSLDLLPPMIHKEDLHSLQHVAVLWGDQEWFQELAERKGMNE